MKRFEGAVSAPRDDEGRDVCARCALAPAERLLFASLKGWAGLRASNQRPHEQIVPLLARKTSGRTAALFVAWIQAVEAACGRPLQIECPGCGGLAADAQRLVVACGVAPVALDVAEAVLEPLLLETAQVALLGRALNAAMAADGWRVPARLAEPHSGASERSRGLTEASQTLH